MAHTELNLRERRAIEDMLNADEAHAEVIEFLERGQKVTGRACEAIEFPDQDAIDLTITNARHQSVEPGAPFAAT